VAPDFVIIGAPRSGTTWLYSQLSRHPDVFLSSNKEPRFFAFRANSSHTFNGPGDDEWIEPVIFDETEYMSLFTGSSGRITGEASTDYLYQSSVAATKMRDLVPDVRIVAILREPVDRAYSAWALTKNLGHERLEFDAAIAAEPMRVADEWAWYWHYVQHGFYARNLAPFFETFPSDQILILTFKELVHEPIRFITNVTEFLEISPVQEALTEGVNHRPVARGAFSHVVRRSLLGSEMTRARTVLPRAVRRRARRLVDRVTLDSGMSAETRVQLGRLYRDDLALLPEVIGRSLDLRQ
jgi:Sulfotransferase domain